ncbi:UbiA family prenyltransferase [Loktanella sp. Alg231-35]|uniref:UbiA family prenyltransferase n=1 Tax=Loktanella sp. Alg231-35 TaxID=1922220 RepID=UPI000D5566C9|nr:UbiA family prenyltransferase [Loktanella sp. Alg231-35]
MSSDPHKPISQDVPLFVDLDGTLLKTDLAEEMLARGFRSATALFAAFKAFLATGLGGLKRSLVENVGFTAELLPYNQSVRDYIAQAKSDGRHVVLMTAADEIAAQEIADFSGGFDEVIGSAPDRNLKGQRKLQAIKEIVGNGPFEYLGDSQADIPIWEAATYRGFAKVPAAAKALAAQDSHVTLTPEPSKSKLRSLIKAMRPHQWAKNALVLAPLLFAHDYDDPVNLLRSAMAFAVFSICASSVYLFNDVLDIEADRAHPTKSRRPFAAGELSPRFGFATSAVLLVLSFLFAFGTLGPAFGAVMVLYFAMTTAYSLFLKSYSTIDVVVLSLLYTVRILAGSAALLFYPSSWLLIFSLFFFLSLAYLKRYTELLKAKGTDSLPSRNYWKEDLSIVQTFGITSGGLSLLTMAQYIQNEAISGVYRTPALLWAIIPLMMFWIYRAWMWASRGKLGDDPVVFAITDRISQISGVIIVGIILLAYRLDLHWMAL